ncbi:hypothetical protein KO489_11765 [Reinekea forsetii]|nr:hypothetical protein [Reinekea forsetii]
MKNALFKALQKVHFLAKPIYWVAACSLIGTLALPVIFPSFDTLYWFTALAMTAFLFSSAAIIDIAFQHQQKKSGLSGWFSNLWNHLMYWAWVVASGFLLLFLLKIISYMITH